MFWHDNWLGLPLQYQYPGLYLAEQNKHATVKQCIDDAGSILGLSLLNSTAQLEKNDLLMRLQDFHLTQQQDELEWMRSKAGFSVKSLYNFMSYSPSPTSIIKNIWKIKAPLRVLVFAWLLLSNRPTTTDNLVKRGWQIPNMCVMCRRDEETHQHLFQSCSLATEIRNYIYTQFGDMYSLPTSFLTNLSHQILTATSTGKIAKQWELVTCFVLWRERCRRLFSNTISQHIALVREIKLEYMDWFT